jgi:hypothetical protein
VTRGLQPAGRDVTTDKMVKELQSSTYSHPVLYDPKRFVNGHINPETVQVSQIKGGLWTPVSDKIVPK